MPCKTLCLGEAGFWRSWKYGNKEKSPKDPSWYGFWGKSIQFWEHIPFWLPGLGSTLQVVWFSRGCVCHHGSWWSWHRGRQFGHLGPCWYASNSTAMWVSQTKLLSNLYCLFQNSWQLISIDSLFSFFKECAEYDRQNPLHWWLRINL